MKQFKRIYIEITNACNLQCDFCPQTRRKLEFMSLETFRHILAEIKGHTRFLFFHVKGEPLLHPELGQFLDLCDEMGAKVNITTNGTLIHKVGGMLLAKPALRQINFSLHSFDGNEGLQSKEAYIGNILAFTKEAIEKSELLIALRLWNLYENNTVNLGANKNRELLDSIERAYDLPYKIEEGILSERGIQIADRLYVNQDHLFQWPDMTQEQDNGAGFCYGLRSQAAILVDGTVVPCCLDGEGVISLGNIKTTSFAKIIESERARNLYLGFGKREAVEDLCKRCDFRKRFGS
ncbi:MAG: SPASM domain-containing protein [Clostridia bacterium]|nr:SPASM domain-containing protein [Clostridia bacterium]